jgi:hypothetical protein
MHGKNLWISCVLAVYFAGQRVRKITRQQAHHMRQPETKKAAPEDGFSKGAPAEAAAAAAGEVQAIIVLRRRAR